MQSPRHLALLLLGLNGLIVGCSSAGNAVRAPSSANSPIIADAIAREQQRSRYIDDHYEQWLKTKRFDNEKDARVYTGYIWDQTQVHRRYDSDENATATASWSSDDARKRAQKQLESDLAKMFED